MDKLLQHYYDGNFLIPTSTDNIRFDPSDNKTWAAYTKSDAKVWASFNDMPNGARRETLECVRRQGILQITLFCQQNIGQTFINQVADEILNYYGVEQSHNLNDGTTLHVMSSYKAQGMPTDAWYMLPITVNYHII